MITSLRGRLVDALPTQITVEVGGVGYEVLIPLSSFDRLPPVGQELHLLTHLAVREDAHTLYGFLTAGERQLFRMLIDTVSGIGPKMALNILSGIQPAAFRAAVATGDVKALSQISGIGKKTAERIVVELKDRLGTLAASPVEPGQKPRELAGTDGALADAVLALAALGFKQQDAETAVRAARTMLGEKASVEELVRASLKKGAA